MTTPLRSVLDAVESGLTTAPAIAERTGLQPDVVQAAIEHLRRMHRLSSMELRTLCAGGGCASCDVACSATPMIRRDEGS